jgi:two-component system chemotaxis response regulator CheY
LQELRKRPEHASVPILMLTTEGSPELIRKAKAAGAKGWMVKPFKTQQLIAAMQKLTESL